MKRREPRERQPMIWTAAYATAFCNAVSERRSNRRSGKTPSLSETLSEDFAPYAAIVADEAVTQFERLEDAT